MVKFINYLKKMNKKLVNYKYGDDLSDYIKINNYILQNYNKNIIGGGNFDYDATKIPPCFESPTGKFNTIEECNTNISKTGIDVLLKAFQKLTDEMLEHISKSSNQNDPTDYKKIAKYLLFNIEVLAQYFPNDSLNQLSNQIDSINTIISQKLKEVQNLSS